MRLNLEIKVNGALYYVIFQILHLFLEIAVELFKKLRNEAVENPLQTLVVELVCVQQVEMP